MLICLDGKLLCTPAVYMEASDSAHWDCPDWENSAVEGIPNLASVCHGSNPNCELLSLPNL